MRSRPSQRKTHNPVTSCLDLQYDAAGGVTLGWGFQPQNNGRGLQSLGLCATTRTLRAFPMRPRGPPRLCPPTASTLMATLPGVPPSPRGSHTQSLWAVTVPLKAPRSWASLACARANRQLTATGNAQAPAPNGEVGTCERQRVSRSWPPAGSQLPPPTRALPLLLGLCPLVLSGVTMRQGRALQLITPMGSGPSAVCRPPHGIDPTPTPGDVTVARSGEDSAHPRHAGQWVLFRGTGQSGDMGPWCPAAAATSTGFGARPHFSRWLPRLSCSHDCRVAP